MEPFAKRHVAIDELKKLMATRIRIDIASTLRHHPHLTGESSQAAYEALANDETVEELVRTLAREEVEAAVMRGELPAVSFLFLAGYTKNKLGEG